MKKNTRSKPAFKLAFCSVLAALEIVLMLLSSFSTFGTYAFPCIAGILSVAAVIEFGWKWALGIYISASMLAALLTGNKEAALYFIALFGYYPILKSTIETHIKNRAAMYAVKFAVFNAAAVGSFFAASFLLSVDPSEFTLFGVYVPYVFLIIGNLFFFFYDRAVGVFVRAYVVKLRDMLFRGIK